MVMRQKSKKWLKQVRDHLMIGACLVLFVQCTSTIARKTRVAKTDTKHHTSNAEVPQPTIRYHLIATNDSSDWLRALKTGDTLTAILAVNRIDRASLLRLDTLLIPDTIAPNIGIYSPFPIRIDSLQKVNKILFISYFSQTFAVYENGDRIRWGPTSLGKKSTPTPTGLFATNWKSKETISTVDPTWIMKWYFNLDNFQGVSMHQYALPGYPASHACARLYTEDAYWLYYWADQWVLKNGQISVYGTPVVIFGEYPFGQRKPWLFLAEDAKALEISPAALMREMTDFLPVVMQRQATRDSLALKTL